jgi:hypothetical protein
MSIDRWSYRLDVNLIHFGLRILRLGSARSMVNFQRLNVTTTKIVMDHSFAVLCSLAIFVVLVRIVIMDPYKSGALSEKIFPSITDI